MVAAPAAPPGEGPRPPTWLAEELILLALSEESVQTVKQKWIAIHSVLLLTVKILRRDSTSVSPVTVQGLYLTEWSRRMKRMYKTVRGWCYDLPIRFEKYILSLSERDEALTNNLVCVQFVLSMAKEEIGRLAEQLKKLELQIGEKSQPIKIKLPSPENFAPVD